jgi:hypothetical protein
MQRLRSRLMTLVLTIFVGLGLASAMLAHPLPTTAELRTEQAVESLQAAGLPMAEICGQTQTKRLCADQPCPICRGASAATDLAFALPLPVVLRRNHDLAIPRGTQPPGLRLLSGHEAQGPPADLI